MGGLGTFQPVGVAVAETWIDWSPLQWPTELRQVWPAFLHDAELKRAVPASITGAPQNMIK